MTNTVTQSRLLGLVKQHLPVRERHQPPIGVTEISHTAVSVSRGVSLYQLSPTGDYVVAWIMETFEGLVSYTDRQAAEAYVARVAAEISPPRQESK